MNTTIKKTKWFWPWQDNKEEAWLEEMSANGWHLSSMHLPCVYNFAAGKPTQYAYRLDYMYMDKKKLAEYVQIFQDAGWEYVGEMSNWRYWRKMAAAGEMPEIFTDNASKIKKYQRLLYFMVFFLLLLVFLGSQMFFNGLRFNDVSSVITMIYFIGELLYAIVIPIYIVVVVKLLLRINQLKKKAL